jgi:hypothetical protein
MQVLVLDHVQLAMPVGREDEARAFYQEALGIPPKSTSPHTSPLVEGAGSKEVRLKFIWA